jgi:hypothetical protein
VREIAEAPRELDLVLGSGLVAVGRVTLRRGHENAEGAEVSLSGPTGPLRARTDREGSYRLEDVAAGPARLTVTLAGHVAVERQVTLEPGTHEGRPVELEAVDLLEAGSAEGEVVDARGDPVEGVRVAKDLVSRYVPVGARSPSAVTDKRGVFRLDELPEGEVVIEAFAPDKGRGKTTAEIRAGRTTDRIRIELSAEPGQGEDAEAGGVAITLGEGQGGVVVRAVSPGSEAERRGLLTGDRITVIDGHAVRSVAAAKARLFGPIADDVVIEIARGGDKQRLRVARERVQR